MLNAQIIPQKHSWPPPLGDIDQGDVCTVCIYHSHLVYSQPPDDWNTFSIAEESAVDLAGEGNIMGRR